MRCGGRAPFTAPLVSRDGQLKCLRPCALLHWHVMIKHACLQHLSLRHSAAVWRDCHELLVWCVQAVPKAKELTRGQLQPAAQAVAEQAMPTAKKITDDNLRPAAQAVADQARCLQCMVEVHRFRPISPPTG